VSHEIAESPPFVVIAGAIHPDAVANLETGARVEITEDPTEAGMVKTAAQADGILFRIRPACTETLMASCRKLKVVGRYGAGLDTVDLPAATRLGVAVVHAPGSNSQSVAEHAVMLMLNCAKKTRQVDAMTRRAEWGPRRSAGVREVNGKTLGIIGVGNIGRIVAKIAGQGFGMNVLGYDPYVAPDELLPQVDVLTCHTPLTPETRGMINERTLDLMKPGAIFVNTSRGPVQQEHALFEALTRGKLAAAGLDVFEEEPVGADNPLLNLDNVVCTSHIAGVTEEAHRAIGMMVTSEMLRVLQGRRPQVLANADLWPRLGHLK